MRTSIIFFMLVVSCRLAGQGTYKLRFGTAANEEPEFVEMLSDGSYLVAGHATGGGGLGAQDALLVKFSAAGTVEWSKVYGGSGNDLFRNIYACSDGNYIAVGETNSFGAGNIDLYAVKFGPGGNTIWERTAGGSNAETGRGVCEVGDGYVLCGGTQSFGAGFWDIFVVKLDFNGDAVWSKAFGNGGGNIGGEVLPAPGNDVWVSGLTFVGSNNHDAPLLRLDATGALVSSTRVGTSGNDNGSYLTQGGAGMVMSGNSWWFSGNTQQNIWIVSFNSAGGYVWAKYYTIPGGGNYIAAVEDTPDGGLVFVPNNANNDTGSALLVKTDGNGNVSWTTSHSYNGSGRARHVRPSPNGGYLVVGSCTGNGRDLFILKTDDQGNVDNCCPDPETVTATAAAPTAIAFTPSIADGPAASAAAGSEDSPGFTETNLCNGPACCITDAGTIGTQNLDVCANESATFTHNGDEVLDGNDLLQFILFSDPNDTLGSILVRANTPAFTFDPATMQPEVTYYVAAIAGNAVGGNVDLNDPCLDISNALQLIWRPLPAVTLSLVNKMDICPGACREVTATFTGSPPFTLTYTAPGLGPVTQTFPGNTGSFQVCVPANAPLGGFSVAATSLTDGYCSCQ